MTASRRLPPFPAGWFVLSFSAELPRGGRCDVTWMGRRVELRRDLDGRPHARTADGAPLELDEQQGVVMGWYDARDGVPAWRVPVPESSGWTAYREHLWTGLEAHPQETSENSVDVAHFASVHGYRDVRTVREAVTRGPLLEAEYQLARPIFRGRLHRLATRTDFVVQVWGLGFSFVETRVHGADLKTRQLVMATPTDGEKLDLRISAAVAGLAGLGPLAAPLLRLARAALMAAYVRDVADDFVIWQHKRYLEHPIVVHGDGPIHRYRRWAAQFYGEATA